MPAVGTSSHFAEHTDKSARDKVGPPDQRNHRLHELAGGRVLTLDADLSPHSDAVPNGCLRKNP